MNIHLRKFSYIITVYISFICNTNRRYSDLDVITFRDSLRPYAFCPLSRRIQGTSIVRKVKYDW